MSGVHVDSRQCQTTNQFLKAALKVLRSLADLYSYYDGEFHTDRALTLTVFADINRVTKSSWPILAIGKSVRPIKLLYSDKLIVHVKD